MHSDNSDGHFHLKRDDSIIKDLTEGRALPESLFLKNARPFYSLGSLGPSAETTSESRHGTANSVINGPCIVRNDKSMEAGYTSKDSITFKKSLEMLFADSKYSSSLPTIKNKNKSAKMNDECSFNTELPKETFADSAEISYCMPKYFSKSTEVSQSIYHLRFSDSNKRIYFEDISSKMTKYDRDEIIHSNTGPTDISSGKLKKKSSLLIIKKIFISFFIARRGAKNANDNVQNKTREIFYYFLFVMVMTIIMIHNKPFYSYHLMKSVKNILVDKSFESQGRTITFESIVTVEDVWAFLEGPFLSTITLLEVTKLQKVPAVHKYVLKENRIMGVPRILQVRMANDSCEILDLFRDFTDYCYSHYDVNDEDKEPFGLRTGNAWTYHSKKELKGFEYSGKITTYGGGGYYLDLKDPKDLYNLKANNWIDRGTRAVFIDFTLYNANLNLFFIAKLVFEKPPSGDIDPSWFPNMTRLTKFASPTDYAVLALEIIFVASIPYFIAKELSEIKNEKAEYFRSMWNYMEILIIIMHSNFTDLPTSLARFSPMLDEDLSNITLCCDDILLDTNSFPLNHLSILCLHCSWIVPSTKTFHLDCFVFEFGVMVIMSNLLAFVLLGPFLKVALEHQDYYLPFVDVSYYSKRNRQVAGVMIFLIYIKILRFLNFNKSLNQLNATMTRCALDVLNFTVMFVLIFVAFAASGTVLFGSHLLEYNSFGESMISLFRAILGDFDYLAIENVNGLMGPIFFFSFIFTIFFIMLNMFLAILADTYGEVKGEKTKQEFRVNNFISGALQKAMDKKWFPKCFIRSRRVVTWDDVLKQWGFSDDNRTSLLLKYGVTADTAISKCGIQYLATNLSPQEEQDTEEEDTCQCSKEELTEMKERLLEMEMCMRRTASYYDYLVNKVERNLDAWAETARRINICKEECFPISEEGNEAGVDFALGQFRARDCKCERKMCTRILRIDFPNGDLRSITSSESIADEENKQKIRRIKFVEIDKSKSSIG